jgi:preprotein translocase subunit SecF
MKFFTIIKPEWEFDFVGKLHYGTITGAILVTVSLVALALFGVNWGIDFAGGTEMQVKFEKAVDAGAIRDVLGEEGFKKNQVQAYGSASDNEMLIRVERLTTLTEVDIEKVKGLLTAAFGPESDVAFDANAGDRITITLKAPAAPPAPKLNEDPGAIQAALREKAAEDGTLPALDEHLLNTLAAKGFSRSAITGEAIALKMQVTAAITSQSDPEYDPLVAQAGELDKQEEKLTALMDTKSGFKLRRTKRTDQAKADTADAIMRSQPHQNKVKYLVHFQGISEKISKALSAKFGSAEVRRVDFVDSNVSKQLRTDGLLAFIIAVLLILVYVAVRFDIYFSPGAIIALIHDALVAMLLFVVFRLEFDLASVAALLTVVGYSINDTIVIYDRIREQLPAQPKKPLTIDEVKKHVNKALNDTLSRTLNTSLTTMFATVALLVLAGGTVRNFAAVLTLGVAVGSYSSIFIATTVYLFLRRNFYDSEKTKASRTGPTREDKARGIV